MLTSWQSFRDQLRSAVEAFVAGDAEPYKRCWSQGDDCTVFGAFGGVVHGGKDIASRLDWAAAQYREGRYVRFDILAEGADDTFGYLVHVERIESLDREGGVVVRERRATHIARREDDGWRVVHQHSDPLVEVKHPA